MKFTQIIPLVLALTGASQAANCFAGANGGAGGFTEAEAIAACNVVADGFTMNPTSDSKIIGGSGNAEVRATKNCFKTVHFRNMNSRCHGLIAACRFTIFEGRFPQRITEAADSSTDNSDCGGGSIQIA